MNFKDKARKMIETVDRWLWKLVGKENDILFHFLRIVLGCVLLAVLVAAALGVGSVLAMVIPPLIAALVAAIPYLITIAVFSGIVGLLVLQNRHEKRQRLRERETTGDAKKASRGTPTGQGRQNPSIGACRRSNDSEAYRVRSRLIAAFRPSP